MLPSTTSLIKILPNPTGNTMYGVISPKVRMQATMRRSSRSRSNTGSSGGIRIGMNAMCTGIRFCDEIDASVRKPISEYLNQKT